jgi:hypothetical protein
MVDAKAGRGNLNSLPVVHLGGDVLGKWAAANIPLANEQQGTN